MTGVILTIIMSLLADAPGRALAKDTERQRDLSAEFVRAGERYSVDPVLLTVWAFNESSFRSDAVGEVPNGDGKVLSEKGLMQVHGKAAQTCRVAGLKVGSIMCGAMLIDMGRRRCGNLERGLWWYASGRCNGTPRAKRTTKYRLRMVERLKKEV